MLYDMTCVVDSYVKNGTTVNICALDISKAFDNMNHDGLFVRLMIFFVYFRRLVLTLLVLNGVICYRDCPSTSETQRTCREPVVIALSCPRYVFQPEKVASLSQTPANLSETCSIARASGPGSIMDFGHYRASPSLVKSPMLLRSPSLSNF